MQPPIRTTKQELLNIMDRCERDLRALATAWPSDLSGLTRFLLLRVASRLLRVLISAGRR